MKRIAPTFHALLFLAIFAGCAGAPHPLIGTWEALDDQGRPTGQVKILNRTHFAFGSQDASGAVQAGGGSWNADEEVYRETIDYHWHTALVGLTVEFRYRLEGNLWHHQADFDTDRRSYHIDEIWRKIRLDD